MEKKNVLLHKVNKLRDIIKAHPNIWDHHYEHVDPTAVGAAGRALRYWGCAFINSLKLNWSILVKCSLARLFLIHVLDIYFRVWSPPVTATHSCF